MEKNLEEKGKKKILEIFTSLIKVLKEKVLENEINNQIQIKKEKRMYNTSRRSRKQNLGENDPLSEVIQRLNEEGCSKCHSKSWFTNKERNKPYFLKKNSSNGTSSLSLFLGCNCGNTWRRTFNNLKVSEEAVDEVFGLKH